MNALQFKGHDHSSVTCPNCGDLVNYGCEMASERLLDILKTGQHHGVFGGEKLEQVAQGILKLQSLPKPDKFNNQPNFNGTPEPVWRQRPIKTVVIDGVEYVPKTAILPDEAKEALKKLHALIWAEGYYDSLNAGTERFAKSLYPYLKILNQILQYKK